jgi:hypothetical protein
VSIVLYGMIAMSVGDYGVSHGLLRVQVKVARFAEQAFISQDKKIRFYHP